jgi:hypothetical protein
MLALTNPGTNSRGLLFDIIWGFEQLGHEVLKLALGPSWTLKNQCPEQAELVAQSFERLVADFIEANRIEFSLAMWCNGTLSLPVRRRLDGGVSAVMNEWGHPHLHYWWDAPHWFNNGATLPLLGSGVFAGQHQLHYINNPYTGAEMSEFMHFSNVIAAPNGVNPETFHPLPGIKKEYDLVFLSGGGDCEPTPVMLDELEKDDPDIERIRRDVASSLGPMLAETAAAFDESMRVPARQLLDALVEHRLADRHSPAIAHLERAIGEKPELGSVANAMVQDPALYVRVTNVVRTIETWERPFLVAYLSRHFKALRLGTQRYDAWGIEGDQIEFVPYHEQSRVYARARFALNVMRWQDDCSLNSKIFEITAARCGCLQAYRRGVEACFVDGKEMLVFRTPREARERLADALASPEQAEAIIDAGHRRTLADHTWVNRMQLVTDALTGTKPPPPTVPSTPPELAPSMSYA